MNDINRCPNHELLVTYLYDDCEPAERESIATHLVLCASCADEVRGLRDARVHLAAWSPPAMSLGFQLARTEAEQPSSVLRPAAWWSRPLPAWAQAAAAVAIFAAGMSAGAFRSSGSSERAATMTAPPAAVVEPVAVRVSQEDLDRLKARLQTLEQHIRTDSVQLVRNYRSGLEDRELLGQLTTMIDQRVVQSDRENLRVLERIAVGIESDRKKVDERLSLVELEQQDVRQAFSRALGPSSLIRAAALR